MYKFLFGFLVLISCNQQKSKNEKPIIIIEHPRQKIINIFDHSISYPIYFYYGNYNFILLDTGKIFYHRYHYYRWCGTGERDYTKPPRIKLFPDELIEIKSTDLLSFLKANVHDTADYHNNSYTAIVSPSDTIRNPAFLIIKEYCKSIKSSCVFRIWTEEEKYAVIAKLNNTSYNPDSVIWKTGFDMNDPPPPNRN